MYEIKSTKTFSIGRDKTTQSKDIEKAETLLEEYDDE